MGTSNQIIDLASSHTQTHIHPQTQPQPQQHSHSPFHSQKSSSPSPTLAPNLYHHNSTSISPISHHRIITPTPPPHLPTKLHSSTLPQSTLHIVDISYPESHLRTPIPQVPYSLPHWLDETSVGGCVDMIIEECDLDVVQSVEEQDGGGGGLSSWGDGRSRGSKGKEHGKEQRQGVAVKRGYDECFGGRLEEEGEKEGEGEGQSLNKKQCI